MLENDLFDLEGALHNIQETLRELRSILILKQSKLDRHKELAQKAIDSLRELLGGNLVDLADYNALRNALDNSKDVIHESEREILGCIKKRNEFESQLKKINDSIEHCKKEIQQRDAEAVIIPFRKANG